MVPEFLADLPRDFMNGRSLIYQRKPGNRYALHSTGEDGRDDGGGNDDLVWPEVE